MISFAGLNLLDGKWCAEDPDAIWDEMLHRRIFSTRSRSSPTESNRRPTDYETAGFVREAG